MRELLEKRLAELKTERKAGHKMIAELDARKADIKAMVLRISGAIQVLEEVLNEEEDDHLEPEPAEAE